MRLIAELFSGIVFLGGLLSSCGVSNLEGDGQGEAEIAPAQTVTSLPGLEGTWKTVSTEQNGFIETLTAEERLWKITADSVYILDNFKVIEFAGLYHVNNTELIFPGWDDRVAYDFKFGTDTLIINEWNSRTGHTYQKTHRLIPYPANLKKVDRLIYDRINWEAFDTLWEVYQTVLHDPSAVSGYNLNYYNSYPYYLDLRSTNRANVTFHRDTLIYSDNKGTHRALFLKMQQQLFIPYAGMELFLKDLDNEDFSHIDYFIYRVPPGD